MINPDQKAIVLAAVIEGSSKWKAAYNSGNAAMCSVQYEGNAMLRAEPLGTFRGRLMIQEFWQKMMSLGFVDITYTNQELEVIDEYSAHRKATWRMNNAHGVIYQERWFLQKNGSSS